MSIEFDAAVLFAPGEDLRMTRVVADPLRADEVLVRMVATGICHTDLTVQRGAFGVPLPIVLGHEGSGVVEQVGAAVTNIAPGDPVGLTFMSCGECAACTEDQPAHCAAFGGLNMSGLRSDGTTPLHCGGERIGGRFFGQSSFARYAIAHRRNVVKVPENVALEMVGPFCCGIQTGAGAIFNTLKARSGESCVIFGGGAVGLSAVMAARISGCDPIILVEPREARRTLGRELGATDTIDPTRQNVATLIADRTGGGAKVVIDTTGLAAVIGDAINTLGHGGRLGLIGLEDVTAEARFLVAPLLAKGASIHAVIEGDSNPREFVPYLIGLFLEGRFPVDKLVSFYDFAQINAAIADHKAGVSIKPIIRFG